jgi:hypothetical protein
VKVGDDNRFSVHGASLPKTAQNDARWLGDLERAWLQNWKSETSSAEASPQKAAAAHRPHGSPLGRFLVSSQAVEGGLGMEGAAARPGPGLESGTSAPGQSDPEVPSAGKRNPGAMGPCLYSENISSTAPTASPDNRHELPSIGPHAVGNDAGHAQVDPQGLSQGNAEAAHAASSWAPSQAQLDAAHGGLVNEVRDPSRPVLNVAVVDAAAQVTLRDASLLPEESRLTGQAIARQLAELGLRSTRVYVNGVVVEDSAQNTFPGAALPSQPDSARSVQTPVHLEER